jgi:hypothetical protein
MPPDRFGRRLRTTSWRWELAEFQYTPSRGHVRSDQAAVAASLASEGSSLEFEQQASAGESEA